MTIPLERVFHSRHIVLAVALFQVDPLRNRNHTGLLYRSRSGGIRLLHLAEHLVLKSEEEAPQGHLFVAPNLDPLVARNIALFCDEVWNKNKSGIPYGIKYSGAGTSFDPQGTYIESQNDTGLSCSTFVLALLSRMQINLLNLDTWAPRPLEDLPYQDFIIKYLDGLVKLGKANEDHYKRNCTEKGCLRFRPEEIAGGALEEEYPVDYNVSSSNGTELLSQLSSLI